MFSDYDDEMERRKSVLAYLIRMIAADGKVERVERKFVLSVGRELEISPEELDAIEAHPENYEINPPPEEQERMTILYYLLFTMAVDGEIHQDEETLCYKLGLKLGFREGMTRDMINVMKRFLNKKLPKDALLKEIKKYMN
jgi:uncharacterized tellurite resistance protein B-like protein